MFPGIDAAKFGVPVCPHAGGVGLCEIVQHLSMFDYVAGCTHRSATGRPPRRSRRPGTPGSAPLTPRRTTGWGCPSGGSATFPPGTAGRSSRYPPRWGRLLVPAAGSVDGAYPTLARLRADGTVRAIGIGVNSSSLAEWFVSRCDLDCVLAGYLSLAIPDSLWTDLAGA